MPSTYENPPENGGPTDTVASVEKAVLGEDQPLAKSHPSAVSGLVFLTYPIILIVLLLIVLAALAFMRD